MASDKLHSGPENQNSFFPSPAMGVSGRAGPFFVPLATPIPPPAEAPSGPAVSLQGGAMPPLPGPLLPPPYAAQPPFPSSWAKFSCMNLLDGCYRISFLPGGSPWWWLSSEFYVGTMRVDRGGGAFAVSGDLYQFLPFSVLRDPNALQIKIIPFGIPIYPRNRYYSYLRVTGVQVSPMFGTGPCQLTLTVEEYIYTQPPAGSFNGTFPAPPGTRTVTIILEPKPAPVGFPSIYLEGKLYAGGLEQGTFTMAWVSSYLRKATLEIDTLVGATPPAAVPASSGSGTEDFRTAFARAGWDLNVVYNQANVPVPANVTSTACWSPADLHNLMTTVRNPSTNLDAEWRLHLVVVPAAMGCGRGVMYDQIVVPREGVASFSDDGYPNSESANFGTAANQQQRNVPRAFLRSACHEVGHGFNQIHQDQEAGADNSIMTITPDVADVLRDPTTGAPGFPANIALQFNHHVRHHLVHFPDIVVRPGGMTFTSGHSSPVPEADRYYLSSAKLALRLEARSTRIELGEPLRLAWMLGNDSDVPVPVPSDIRIESQHAFITVTNPNGVAKPMPSFVIQTDRVHIQELAPGESLRAETWLFWSSRGFAFETPGRHSVQLRIVWTHSGLPFGMRATIDVWVNYPRSAIDNEAADILLDPEVGMYVALGGGAAHLTGAVARLERVMAMGGGSDQPPKALAAYGDLLPKGQTK